MGKRREFMYVCNIIINLRAYSNKPRDFLSCVCNDEYLIFLTDFKKEKVINCRENRSNERPRTWQMGHLKEWAGFLVSSSLTLPSAPPRAGGDD